MHLLLSLFLTVSSNNLLRSFLHLTGTSGVVGSTSPDFFFKTIFLTTLLEVEFEAVDPSDIEEWIGPGLGTLARLNFIGYPGKEVTPTNFFPVLVVLTPAEFAASAIFILPALLATEPTEAPNILLARSLTGELRLSSPRLGVVRILIVDVPDVRRVRVGVYEDLVRYVEYCML